MGVPKLIVKERLLVDKRLMPKKAVKQRYRLILYDEDKCAKCDNLELRPNELCRGTGNNDSCPNFIADYKLYQEGANYWSVPQGDLGALQKLLDKKKIDFETVEKRKAVPFRYPIKFTGKLFGANAVDEHGIKRINQIKLLKTWFEHKNGILLAKPRSGKTVLAVRAACALKQKTIILMDRFELMNQFYRTFMGYPKRGRKPMTNIPQLQKRTGKEIIRIAQKAKDLKNLEDVDILIVNYQKFVRNPDAIVNLVNDNFSFLIVDEVHGTGAVGYLRVVSKCSVLHRMGLSATPRRKDNRHKLIYRIMGQVVARSNTASLIPNLNVYESKTSPPRAYKIWHHAMAWLCSNQKLQKELLQQLFKDLRNGHKVIIVPLDRKNHIDMLVKMVNHQARINNEKKGEKWPKDLAIKFYDGVDREDVLDKVDDGKPRILFAMRSMIKQGIDFLLPSKIHIFMPMSASKDRETGAPMLEQLSNRVCTPYPKPQPEITVWSHTVGMFQSCTVGLFWNEIWPNRFDGKVGKYRVTKELAEQVTAIRKNSPSKTNSQKNFDWVG